MHEAPQPGSPPRIVPGARALAAPLTASVVTLGTFDGVHLGHRRLVGRAVEEARARGLPAVAYTFDPHPAKLLAPHAAPPLLATTAERVERLLELGVDLVVLEPFDRAFADLEADTWVARDLVGALHPVHVVVGFNFSYGRGRGGDPAHLVASGARHGFGVEVIDAIEAAGGVVSSTRIRGLLRSGAVQEAAQLLGLAYALSGVVIGGDRRGRTIGFPTANLEVEQELLPAHGVYATRASIDGGPPRPAVTNVGVRPTFDGSAPRVETHLLDFEGDLYGRRLRVELVAHLRPERRFEGLDALVRQIALDAAEARRVLGA